MKKAGKGRNYIAGLDIIGPENTPSPLSFFEVELQKFQAACAKAGANAKFPFLFHVGESHSDPNGNLDVALELNPKRIAHGYAIPRKSRVLGNVKKRGQSLCIECCPISNQILELHHFARQAVVYDLMEANVSCALASDNPTLCSSVLAHDFYPFMIAKKNFRLQHWRQLMQDSLKHAVWNSAQEFERVYSIWERAYVKFVIDILKETMEAEARAARNGNSQKTTTSPAAICEAPAAKLTNQAIQGGNQNTLASRPGPPTTSGQTQRRPDGQTSAQVPGRGGPPPQRRVINNTAASTSGSANGAVENAAPRNSNSSAPTNMPRGTTGTTSASTTGQSGGVAPSTPQSTAQGRLIVRPL